MLKNIGRFLEKLALDCSTFAGTSTAFALAILLVFIWAVTGPLFHYCDVWQMVINTVTSIMTFLMVFLIQRAQNKDILSIHAKLNELIATQEGASNRLVGIEDCSEEELILLREQHRHLSGPDDYGTESKSVSQVLDMAAAEAKHEEVKAKREEAKAEREESKAEREELKAEREVLKAEQEEPVEDAA